MMFYQFVLRVDGKYTQYKGGLQFFLNTRWHNTLFLYYLAFTAPKLLH